MKRKILWLGGLAAVFFASVLALGNVSALTEDELIDYSLNEILFYEKCKVEDSSAECGITVSGSTIEEKIWSGLTSFMTDEQAAGVMGNMAHEGGFNPARHEGMFLNANPSFAIMTNKNDSYGMGLIQWSFGRRVKLLDFIKEKASDLLDKYIDKGRKEYGNLSGKDFLAKAGDSDTNTLIALELCRLKQEFEENPTYAEVLKKNTVQEAADYFLEKVEVPANIEGTRPVRRADAQKYYDQFHGKSVSGSASTTSDSDSDDGSDDPCNSSVEGSKNINGAAVALAWPLGTPHKKYDWNGGTGTELFNEVYPKLLKKGNRRPYHGCYGPVYGASCDRFVSTVVRYSGYDKNFPTGVGLSRDNQGGYPLDHKDKWERIDWNGDPSKLQAGDVVLRSGHVAIAVQDEKGKFYIAEAGLCHSYGHIRNIRSREDFDYIIRATHAKNSNVGVSVKNGVKSSSLTGTISKGTGRNNGDINASANYLAWPMGTSDKTSKRKAYDKFVEFFNSLKGHKNTGGQQWQDGKSCSVFVNTVLLYAGAFDGGKHHSPGAIIDKMIDSDDWEEIDGSGTGNLKYSDLQPGDVLFYYSTTPSPGNESKHNFRGLHMMHVALFVKTEDGKSAIAEAHFERQWGHIREVNSNKKIPSTIRIFRWKKQGSEANCNICDGGSDIGNMQLKAGGMTLAEAKEFMKAYRDAAMGKYYKVKRNITFQGAFITNANCPYGVMNNCVAFSQWFINKFTTIGPNWGNTTNGVAMVAKLTSTKGLKKGNSSSPRPYAIFSNAQWSSAGHTGVVLGVDEKSKKIIVGEASCSWSGGGLNYEPKAAEYSFDYIKKHGWSFAYTDSVLTKGGSLRNV